MSVIMEPGGWYYVVECWCCKQAIHVFNDLAEGKGQDQQYPHQELNLLCTSCGQQDRYNAASAQRVQIPQDQT